MSDTLNYISQITAANPLVGLALNFAATAVAVLLIYFIVGKIISALIKTAKMLTSSEEDEKFLAYLKKPVGRLIILIGAYIFFDSTAGVIGDKIVRYLNGIVYILIVLQVVLVLIRFIELLMRAYSNKLFERGIVSGKEELFPLVMKVTKIIVFFIALIIILKHFNQDVQSLVVSLGVGSLAIALAAQETLANMIAGFVIMTDRPFRVGDRIQLQSGEKGDVYSIGLRSTKVLTFDNTLIIVPNAEIVKEKVLNLSYPDPITRVKVEVGVAYGADLGKAKEILVEVCREHPKVLKEPEPAAYFLNFGDSSLDLMVVCRVPSWKDEWFVAEEIRMEIDRRFKKEGIEIPFPQRTLWWGKKPDDNQEES